MGPLNGFRVIELKGIGPCPHAGMLLADMGAEVIVIDRASPLSISLPAEMDVNFRGKTFVKLNLKLAEDVEKLLQLVETSDALIEGFRPGVAERLGFGPDVCMRRKPELVYGRMTGWGQTGPLAQAAGHDLNYIALTGALAAIGSAKKPYPPLNLVGDYAGGSMFLVVGVLAALLEVSKTGIGQVIDAAITDGSANLMSIFYSMSALGLWCPKRQSNMLDGAAHFYDVYETSDNKWVSIGSIEPQFYTLLLEKTGVKKEEFSAQNDPDQWPKMKARLVDIFKTKTRDEWCQIMEGSDLCFAPVLDYNEAPEHEHNKQRGTFIEINGITQPAPAPRFSKTQCETPEPPEFTTIDKLLY